jgi:hypothetical protein
LISGHAYILQQNKRTIGGKGQKREKGNRSGGNQENELHGIGWNHYEQAVVIDFIANNSE